MSTPRLLAHKYELDEDRLLQTKAPRLLNTTLGVLWRVRMEWNSLLLELRLIGNLPRFKLKTKKWIIDNRTPEPGNMMTPDDD